MRFLAPTSWNSAIFAQLASSSPVTLNTEITVIRAFLYWCKEFKGLKENPAAKIKPRQVIQKAPMVYADEDVKQMLQKANAVEKALILTLCYTGLCEQEICHLTWSDVDLKKKLLRVSPNPSTGSRPRPGPLRLVSSARIHSLSHASVSRYLHPAPPRSREPPKFPGDEDGEQLDRVKLPF
jgi:integrase